MDIYHNGKLFLVFMYMVSKPHFGYTIIKKYYHQPNRTDLIHVRTEMLTH
jgi:hypothetical protein